MSKRVSNFLYEELSYQIRGACFEVYNSLGKGHKELIYQNSLAIALTKKNIQFEREKRLHVSFQGQSVGVYRPDFLINKQIVVELKASEFLPPNSHKQLFQYLKTTELPLGFLVNFGNKLEIYRRVYFLPGKVKK